MRSLSVAAFLASLAVFAIPADTAPIAEGRYAHMHMKYERTWFGIDVAQIDVWFDPVTRDRFREIAAGHGYSEPLAEQVARTALGAKDVLVQVEFLRNASLGEFLDAAKKNLARARDAGYISNDTFTTAWNGVRSDFAALGKRGFKDGDRLVYRAHVDSLQTVVTSGNQVLLDVLSRDLGSRQAMIASYFAPRTDFRKGLIKSVF